MSNYIILMTLIKVCIYALLHQSLFLAEGGIGKRFLFGYVSMYCKQRLIVSINQCFFVLETCVKIISMYKVILKRLVAFTKQLIKT